MEFEAVRPKYSPPLQSLHLLQVHVFFRHGDRSPTPAFGNSNPEVWSSRLEAVPPLLQPQNYQYQERPFGHLTRKGAEQARGLGAWIKDAYLEELGVDTSQPDSFLRVRSTNFLRTHMTAWFVLEALLGSGELAASVPICISEDRLENLYHNDHCARLAKLWRASLSRKRQAEVRPDGTVQETGWCDQFEDIRFSFSKHLDLPQGKRFPWVLAADVVHCALAHGDPVPDNFTVEKLCEIRDFLAQDYVSSFQDREICELSMGRLLREVVSSMENHRDTPSLYLYSGHDATLVPLSVALGRPWQSWPSYAASISIELWRSLEDSNQHFVRVLYDGVAVPLPVELEGIEQTWKPEQQNTIKSSKKTLFTLQEFVKLAGWTMLSDAEFQNKCQCI
ncbi:lysophosphatidic acid phosphatase type 6 [Selaginella moellendorffii]|uniref:lysophosphatidic acid phosphatase type 6 n=1 Tax=Selaginella moellendorffii TaxID=88036 RepID=UPI000D1CDCC3|nr:lysophosphatidic acid phosphatase type 6 [Selaginella moellendorffii]|eukprot:XP_024520858.1 lysophosphatidic acid phosphatase type 6 [Selaginella moellendorffii]